MMSNSNVVAGLDLGTTKVCIIVSSRNEYRETQVIGFGSSQIDQGFARSNVININKTTEAIKKAALEAGQTASYKISGVNVGVSGEYVQCTSTTVELSINPDQIVRYTDIDRLLEKAKRSALSMMKIDQEIIHLIPQEFTIDEQQGIADPIGMAGQFMRGKIYVVSGIKSKLRNIKRCVEMSGLKVNNLTFEPIASGLAVIKEDERKSGVAVIDIGGGTTDVIIYTKGVIQHSDVLKIASTDVTNDIAQVLKTLYKNAEDLKRNHGSAYANDVDPSVLVPIPGIEGQPTRQVSKRKLALIIEARMIEVFEIARDIIKKSGCLEHLNAGVILTGGGSLIPGLKDLGEEILGLNVRIGSPTISRQSNKMSIGRNNPIYATVVGLTESALGQIDQDKKISQENIKVKPENIDQNQEKKDSKTDNSEQNSKEEYNEEVNLSFWKQFKNWFDQI